jgi:hypothetical protein
MLFGSKPLSHFANAAPTHQLGIGTASPVCAHVNAVVDAHVQRCTKVGYDAATKFISVGPGRLTTLLLGAPERLVFIGGIQVGHRDMGASLPPDAVAGPGERPRNRAPSDGVKFELGYQTFLEEAAGEGVVGATFAAMQRVSLEIGTLIGAAIGYPLGGMASLFGGDFHAVRNGTASAGRNAGDLFGSLALGLPRLSLEMSRATVLSGYNMLNQFGAYAGATAGVLTGAFVGAHAALDFLAGPGGLQRGLNSTGIGILFGTVVGCVAGASTAAVVGIRLAFEGAALGAITACSLYACNIVGGTIGIGFGLASTFWHFQETAQTES